MGAAFNSLRVAGRRLSAEAHGTVLMVFAVTLFVSAFLLFSVQPMFAKMVLPQLGGSPSVWAVSTCFFQAALLAGYCYAHLLNRFVDWRLAPAAHLLVMALAYLALPVGLPEAAGEPPNEGTYSWLVGVLAAGVGLPFFAVAANAPLLQVWFSRTGNRHASDPYFLYGASNLGSLIALLSYPVLIEPAIGLGWQATLWSQGFFVLALAIATAGLMMISAAEAAPREADRMALGASGPAPTWVQRARWVLYAAVPSGLLVAFTTHLSTDIAAAPFLWVVPLAIFLGTFVVVFRDEPLVPTNLMSLLQPAAVVVALMSLVTNRFDWWQASLAAFAAFLVTTLVAHRRLFDDRPAALYLTGYYLWMSFGGALGGIFAAIIAPQIFSTTYEFPILLLLGMLCRPGVFASPDAGDRRRLVVTAFVGSVLLAAGLALVAAGRPEQAFFLGTLMVLFSGVPLLIGRRDARFQAAVVAVLVAGVIILPSMLNRGTPTRSFFGVLRVLEVADGSVRRLAHGTVNHGAERLIAPDGSKVPRPVPSTYYHPKSPMARAVVAARQVHDGVRPFRSGVVGLGIGSMACYAKPGEVWRFFEIDPAVVAIATDASRFHFLSACAPGADIVLGDARLTLAKEPEASLDYLQIDAFSSDSIPTHLLTLEAMRLFLGKLTEDGVLVVHVSNRHLDLAPVAAAAAKAVPGTHAAIVSGLETGDMPEDTPSIVVVVTKSDKAIAPFLKWDDAEFVTEPGVKPWTDDYSDIVSALVRHYRQ